MTQFAAMILAGGKSSRMGTDKALITVHGVPLLQKVCQVAQTVVKPVYVVTPWGECYQEIIPPGCEVVSERQEGKPCPLIGFIQGLAQVQTEWVLLLACDLPNLEPTEVQHWVQHLDQVSPDTIALLPKHPKGWEPLCGFYRRCSLPLLETYVNQGGRSFQGWLAQVKVAELPVSDFRQLYNCNTPADLQALKGEGS
jgi:molybdopterin-guanine dinucleotide biosynthesis protein A